MNKSEMLFAEAVEHIPGGVNSPVRAFGSVGETPRFIASAKGAYMTDADGQTYLDFVGSWGPMILGHNHPEVLADVLEACREGLSFGAATEREVEMADLDLQHRSLHRDGPYGQFRYGSRNERYPGGQRLYRTE